MNYKKSVRSLLCLMILIGLSLISANWVWAQSDDVDIPVELSLRDFKEIDRRLQDYEILREVDKAKDDRISNLEKDLALAQKELDLKKREGELNERIIDLQKREIDLTREDFNRMKDIADRAIKLSEQGKRSTFQDILEWIIRIALFAAGVFAAK